jgi:hypothetical protein
VLRAVEVTGYRVNGLAQILECVRSCIGPIAAGASLVPVIAVLFFSAGSA